MSERAAPYYCPYCGEEDIAPFGDAHGEWRCAACLRVWRLSFLGSTGRGDEDVSLDVGAVPPEADGR